MSEPDPGVRVYPTGYDADGIALECPVCRKDLLWDEKQPAIWPLAVLVKIAEDHQPGCVPFVPEPAPVMVKPVITPDPEPVLGKRAVKLGGRQ